MKYTKVTDPVRRGPGSIDCMVTFEQWPDPQPFHATPTDYELHGRSIYYECVFGLYGPIKEPERKETWLSALKKVVLGKLRLPGLG